MNAAQYMSHLVSPADTWPVYFLRGFQRLMQASALILALGAGTHAIAQENVLETVTASQQGANVVVRLGFAHPLAATPAGFAISSPARVVLDFATVRNGLGTADPEIGVNEVRSLNVVEAGGRTRLVFNLTSAMSHAVAVDGNVATVTFDGSGQPATAINAAGTAARPSAARQEDPSSAQLRGIDFRRGSAGEGRVVIDLPRRNTAVEVREQGQQIVVDLKQAELPHALRRKLDVSDFGTPVQAITALSQGNGVRLAILPSGTWDYSAYQSDSQLVVEVRPRKDDDDRFGTTGQRYRGEKLSFNFQNIEVRAVLQIIADFTGLNIIASDSVTGTLTLNLKEVPWDQALDIVMQAKGLDMRKNGSVMWIAPKEELLAQEKLALEQRSQIAQLEPLKTEHFQLNYQKAESFKQILDTNNTASAGAEKGQSLLSKRGGVVVDARTNQLFVTDISSRLEEVRKLVQKIDIPSRQVLIEARIVEADDKFSRNLGAKLGFMGRKISAGANNNVEYGGTQNPDGSAPGVNLPSLTTLNGNQVNLPAAGLNGASAASMALTLFGAAGSRLISLELSALESEGKGKILSSPRVITADQLTAIIEQGTELPYQVATSSGATSLAFRKANLRLEVTPQITPDGNVILDVDVNKDSVGQATLQGFAIDTKHVKTQVLIENGGTVVIGGIYIQQDRDTVTKVPLLGDIPVMGNLFKTRSRTNDKTELLIFLTPKVLNDKVAIR